MKRMHLGRRLNGSFGAEISAIGASVDDFSSPKLFSSDAGFLQILFEGALAMRLKKSLTGSGAGTVCTWYGAGTFLYPRQLAFKPLVKLASFQTNDATPDYTIAEGGYGSLELQFTYESLNDRVNVYFQNTRTIDFNMSNVSVRVSVTNLPWGLS